MKGVRRKAEKKFGCKWCFHQDNCIPQAGLTDRALYYDKAEKEEPPF